MHTLRGMIRSLRSEAVFGRRNGTICPLLSFTPSTQQHEYRLEFVEGGTKLEPYVFHLMSRKRAFARMRRQLHLDDVRGELTARQFHGAGGLRFLEDSVQIFPRTRKKK